jgi:hypothetical protein
VKKVLSVQIDQEVTKPQISYIERFWREGQKLSKKQVSQLNSNGVFFREALYLKNEKAILVVLDNNTEEVFQGEDLAA